MTKTNAASPEAVRGLISRLGAINPSARVFEAVFGEMEADELFLQD